jgi:uncharacterized protein with FMN-binding domain
MKRGLLIGVGTLGGLGAVFAITPPQFGTSGPSGLAALPGRASTPSAAPVDAAPSNAGTGPATGSSTPTKKATTKPAPNAPVAASGVTGTFDGNTASTRWGPVQVRIVVKDGKIVAASALQSPDGDSRSRSISEQAIPYLVQETLAAQSDQISGVSGASYTSNGWFTSLQSALKKAGL